MDTSLSVNGRHFVRLSFDAFHLHPGAGVHHAMLPVELIPATGATGTVVDASCAVHLREPRRLWLGDARLDTSVPLSGDNTITANFYFSLTDQQIDHLEELCQGRDIILDLIVLARLLIPGQEVLGTRGGSDTMIMVRREEWLRQLNNVSRSSWTSVGLIAPTGPGALMDVRAHLVDAKRLFDKAEYPSAATAVRKALEVIRKQLIPNDAPSEKAIVDTTDREKRTYERRLMMLWHAAWSLACLGPHADPEAARFIWQRQHVETLLGLTTGIAAQIAASAWPRTFPAIPLES